MYLKKFFESVLPPLSWTVMILVLLCLPGSTLSGIHAPHIPHLDKYVHFLLFMGLGGLWNTYLICKKNSPENLKKGLSLVFLLAVAYGGLLEIVQYCFVPDRSFDVLDIVADAAGAAVAWTIFHFKILRINSGN